MGSCINSVLGRVGVKSIRSFAGFIGTIVSRTSFSGVVDCVSCTGRSPSTRVIFNKGKSGSMNCFIRPAIVQAASPVFGDVIRRVFNPIVAVCICSSGGCRRALRLYSHASPCNLANSVFTHSHCTVSVTFGGLHCTTNGFCVGSGPANTIVTRRPFNNSHTSNAGSGTKKPLGLVH